MKNNLNRFLQFNSINKLNEKWELFFNFLFTNIKKYKWCEHFIEYFKIIYKNKIFFILFIILTGWYWSSLLLKILYLFMLIDSLVISLLVLQNKSININSRRLCKNVILIFMTNINLIGGMFSLLMMIFMYMEYSKLINRIIFKFIKFSFKLISNFIPFINVIYPQIKFLNFEDPDNTIYSDLKNKSYSDSDSTSYSNVSSEFEPQLQKKNKFYYLNNKNNKNNKKHKKSKKF